ncbi:MAG TPA: copper transporter [Limnochorda sp.]
MVEWRTHLASLGAIFLALALGMVIGLGLGADDGWTQRQQAALDRIEMELNASRRAEQALRARQEQLAREVEHWRALVAAGLPVLAEGRLAGRTVALLAAHGDQPPRKLTEVLRRAGAQVLLGVGTDPGGPPERVDALIVLTSPGISAEALASLPLLPGQVPEAAYRLLLFPDRFPGRDLPLPEGWAAIGPLDHPAGLAMVVLGLALQAQGRFGWSPEGPQLP